MSVRLIYTSIMKDEWNNQNEMVKINTLSQRNNGVHNVGGELCWNQDTGSIVQIIEGNSNVVSTLYAKIKRDI